MQLIVLIFQMQLWPWQALKDQGQSCILVALLAAVDQTFSTVFHEVNS